MKLRNQQHRLNKYSFQNVMNKDADMDTRAASMTGQK
jgi:hypothetical protein